MGRRRCAASDGKSQCLRNVVKARRCCAYVFVGVSPTNNYSNLLYRVWKNLYSKYNTVCRKELLEGKKSLEEHLEGRRKQEPFISHADCRKYMSGLQFFSTDLYICVTRYVDQNMVLFCFAVFLGFWVLCFS